MIPNATATSGIIPFNFDDKQIRVITRDNSPWFVAADVCRALDHSNPSMALMRLDEDEKTTLNNNEGQAGSGPQTFNLINESGLYNLIFTSSLSR